MRLERAFGVRLPISLVTEAETIGDLLQRRGAGRSVRRSRLPTRAARGSASVGDIAAATEATTLIDVLEWHVAQHPDRLHATVLEDETKIIATLSYGELAAAARVRWRRA